MADCVLDFEEMLRYRYINLFGFTCILIVYKIATYILFIYSFHLILSIFYLLIDILGGSGNVSIKSDALGLNLGSSI